MYLLQKAFIYGTLVLSAVEFDYFLLFLQSRQCRSGLILLFTRFSFIYKFPITDWITLNYSQTEHTAQNKPNGLFFFSFELWFQALVMSCVRCEVSMQIEFSLRLQYYLCDLCEVVKESHLVDNVYNHTITLFKWIDALISDLFFNRVFLGRMGMRLVFQVSIVSVLRQIHSMKTLFSLIKLFVFDCGSPPTLKGSKRTIWYEGKSFITTDFNYR